MYYSKCSIDKYTGMVKVTSVSKYTCMVKVTSVSKYTCMVKVTSVSKCTGMVKVILPPASASLLSISSMGEGLRLCSIPLPERSDSISIIASLVESELAPVVVVVSMATVGAVSESGESRECEEGEMLNMTFLWLVGGGGGGKGDWEGWGKISVKTTDYIHVHVQWNLRIKDTWGPEQVSFIQRCPLFGG